MLNFLQNIYGQQTSRVRTMFGLTQPYSISLGVRQGCVLSPTLFNIFINDIIEEPSWEGIVITRDQFCPKLNGLMYADDVIFLANLEAEIIKAADHVTQWCIKWKMTANIKKCGFMCIKSPGMYAEITSLYPKIKILGKPVPVVKKYKYLGVWLDTKLSFKDHREVHLEKCENLLYKEMCKLTNRKLSFWAKLKLIKETFIPHVSMGR